MRIRLKRLETGVVLTCLPDGHPPAVQRSAHGGFFAAHDLMHFAVETTLGLRRAFLGLMAEGWSFETFGDRDDARYLALPAEAILAERLVDILLRRVGEAARRDEQLFALWVEDVNAELRAVLESSAAEPFQLTFEQAREICGRFDDLAAAWGAVEVGAHLELKFGPTPQAPTQLPGR